MMKKWRTIGALVTAGCLAAVSLTACSGSDKNTSGLDGTAQLAAIGEDTVTVQEGYFVTRWQQARYANMASQLYGEEWYNEVLGTEDHTFQEEIKSNVQGQIEMLHLCRQHAADYKVALSDSDEEKVKEAVDSFLKSNSAEAQGAMMADEAVVTDVLTNYALYDKLYDTITAQADVTVTDEEVECRTYDYVYQALTTTDEDGNTVDMTTLEQQNYLDALETIVAEAEKGTDFETAASNAGYNVAEHAYCAADEDSFSGINSEADKLKVGEVSQVIPVEGGLFVISVTSDKDDEATEEKREEVLANRQMEYFDQQYQKWADGTEISWDEELWGQITFEPAIKAQQ